MSNKRFTLFACAIVFTCSSVQAHPKSWGELTRLFRNTILYDNILKPNLQHNIGLFFAKHIDSIEDQLLYIETQGSANDTILDFLAFHCYGVLKQVVPSTQENRERFLELAVEHLFHEALLRLGKLSDRELHNVVRASLGGKYSVMMTLTKNRLFTARDRLMYFLIAKSLDVPEIAILSKQAMEAPGIMKAMERELEQLRRPLVESWEEIEDGSDFLESEIERHKREYFLTEVLNGSL